MKYKINKIEQKEYEGRKYAKASITALDGTEYPDISLGDKWGDKLQTLKEGQDIEGNVWQNPKNQKWSLYPTEDRPKSNPAYKSQMMKETMERKENSISKFQDNKELSIKISSTMRDAVLLAIAEGKPDQDNILRWREWLWLHWDCEDKDFAPFPDK